MDRDDRRPDRDLRADAVRVLHGEDDRDDRAGPGQQRHAQRYERDVDVLGLLRLVRLAGQQVERDEQEQQPARDHQRGHGDMQVVQDLLAEQAEDGDHTEGDAAACQAIRRCTLAGRPEVSARKIGVIPGGSMITKRVRKREPKTATSNTVMALRGEARTARDREGTTGRDRSSGRTASDGAAASARHRERRPVARRVISP